jgi:hypothetical protein
MLGVASASSSWRHEEEETSYSTYSTVVPVEGHTPIGTNSFSKYPSLELTFFFFGNMMATTSTGFSREELDDVVTCLKNALSDPELRKLNQRAVQATVWHHQPQVSAVMQRLRLWDR